MTGMQISLLAALQREFPPIVNAEFSGNTLSLVAVTSSGGRAKKNTARLTFDDAGTLAGPAVDGTSLCGTWAEAYARSAFFLALLIGQGEAVALDYHAECRARGTASGAPQWFCDQHQAAPA